MDRLETTSDILSPARRNVLIALKERGEASADDLAESLHISPSAVRQHLTGLRSAGFVETRPERGRPGRPVDLYHSTRRGDAVFAPSDGSLTLELLQDLEAEDPRIIDRVFQRREHRRAEAFRAELDGLTIEARLSRLCELLDAEGYLARWAAADDGTYRLTFNNCAIWNVAEHYRLACTSELDFLRDVLPDVGVERAVHRRDGSYNCGYTIRPH
ncbi:MAG: MarR family transcriptional regulator [Actinobacteria bacterium]|nr:MarR family transcriptional regulator [Actinomycetota bacterium]